MKKLFNILPILTALAVMAFSATNGQAVPKKTNYDSPGISCVSQSQVSINVQVCAGASGAPSGFTVQWISCADYNANPSGTPGWWSAPSYCGGSFSGNANLSRYILAPNGCATVNIGELLFDEGASTTCDKPLDCGICYVFRAFAHGDSKLGLSPFSSPIQCSTLACGHGNICTLTQGYWKQHPCEWPTPFVPGANGTAASTQCALTPNPNEQCACDSVNTILLGTASYTQCQLLCILGTPAAGNGLIALAHQLIAAKLNINAGADGTAVAQCIADADALIGNKVVPPVGGGILAPSATSTLISCLTAYNEGAIGPGHCN